MTTKEKQPALPLGDDLTLEERRASLLKYGGRLRSKKHRPLRLEGQVLRCLPDVVYEGFAEAAREEDGGLNLDDDWYRLCATHRYEVLVFDSRERYQDEYLSAFSKNFKATRDMRVWPQLQTTSNPWRHTVLNEVQPLKIRWVEEFGQYKVEFTFDKGVTQTFWFYPEFKDSSMGEGWVTPRQVNKTFPFAAKPIARRRKKHLVNYTLDRYERIHLEAFKAAGDACDRIKALIHLYKRYEDSPEYEVKAFFDSQL